MDSKNLAILILAAVCSLTGVFTATADVNMPVMFTDHMVVQQGIPVRIWGWADADEKVSVTIGNQTRAATPDADGRWEVTFDPMKPGKPFEVTIAGHNTVTLHNVVAGEVWICSGQSNMRWPVFVAANAQRELANANHPDLRLFLMPDQFAAEPLTTREGQQQLTATNVQWQPCTAESAKFFSAVG